MDFDTWYQREYRRVLAAVTVVCRASPARTEDATTDAFVKAFERWGSVSKMTSPTGWVTQVAINNAKRSFRKSGRLTSLGNQDKIAEVLADSYPDADLARALAKLTYRQRRALILHYIEDRTQASVADDLGVAPGTASATLAQARKKLRSQLEPLTEKPS